MIPSRCRLPRPCTRRFSAMPSLRMMSSALALPMSGMHIRNSWTRMRLARSSARASAREISPFFTSSLNSIRSRRASAERSSAALRCSSVISGRLLFSTSLSLLSGIAGLLVLRCRLAQTPAAVRDRLHRALDDW